MRECCYHGTGNTFPHSMTSIRSSAGDASLPPRRSDIPPLVPSRQDLAGKPWVPAVGGNRAAQGDGGVIGEHRSMFAGLNPQTQQKVMGHVQTIDVYVRGAVDCFEPRYRNDGKKIPHDISSVRRNLDLVKGVVDEVQRLTGATTPQILRESLYPYFDRGEIKPSEIVNMLNELNLSHLGDYGGMLEPLIETCVGYVKTTGQTMDRNSVSLSRCNEIDGALIAISTFQSTSVLPPVTLGKAIGSGAFNTVFLTTDGKVFKPAPDVAQVSMGIAADLGIPDMNPRFMERSVLASEVDDMLGFGVVSKTEFARSDSVVGIQMERINAAKIEKTAMVAYDMEGLKRKSPVQYANLQAYIKAAQWDADGRFEDGHGWHDSDLVAFLGSDNLIRKPDPKNPGNYIIQVEGNPVGILDVYSDPKFRRDAVCLQLEDAISGHADRHKENYLVELTLDGSGVARVVGIDNDTTFGKQVFDLNQMGSGFPIGHNMLPFPRVVDTDMLSKINGLDEGQFRDVLSKRLTPDEVDATIKRLELLKNHLNSGRTLVIQPDQWGSDQVRQTLEVRQSDVDRPRKQYSTSYYGRESSRLDTDPTLRNLPRVPLGANTP